MCWSAQASATLATIGLASTTYVAIKGEDKALWIPLAYFSLMELLQAFTYTVIDQCGLPLNELLTLLGALHITFQPFFLNAFAMHFIPLKIKEKISPYVYGFCFLGAIAMLIKIYPFQWANLCNVGHEPFCGQHLCSVHGNWHIAWEAPLNGFRGLTLGYYLPVFLLPFLYGSWKFVVYHLISGPLLARILTNNINEWPAVWCLLSIGLLLLVIKTPLREILYTQKWWLWKTEETENSPVLKTKTPDLILR